MRFYKIVCGLTVAAVCFVGANAVFAAEEAAGLPSQYQPAAGGSKFIPECVTRDGGSSCRDVSVFVSLGINIAEYLFAIVGALALGAFVYGGVMMIISGGNQEKVKKGTDAIMAAVIGLVVAFGGYLLVQFLGQAAGVATGTILK